MSIETIAQLCFHTHYVHIGRSDLGTLYCFKYTDSRCDFQVFEENHELSASDWILEPLPSLEFIVRIEE